jgi:uracil-DNA glycosylase family 4
MTDRAATRPDPRAASGGFHRLMTKIRACKKARTCPLLVSRSLYFEPNPVTVREWQASGAYLAGVDRRVVFVCESPGPRFRSRNETAPSRCWATTIQDERFRRARETYGFTNCYITNTVKCGPRRGARHTQRELNSCRGFLVRELELLQPSVAVGVGGNAYRTLREDVLPLLPCPPVLFQITHYSARRDLHARWKREFAELKRLLKRLKPRSE